MHWKFCLNFFSLKRVVSSPSAKSHFLPFHLQDPKFCSATGYTPRLLLPRVVCGTFHKHHCLPATARECSQAFQHRRIALETQLPDGCYSKHLTKGGRFSHPQQLAQQYIYNHMQVCWCPSIRINLFHQNYGESVPLCSENSKSDEPKECSACYKTCKGVSLAKLCCEHES